MTYRYVSQSLLEEKYHYRYTAFEGPEFLSEYLRAREDLCRRLRDTPSVVGDSERARRIAESVTRAFGAAGQTDTDGREVSPAVPGRQAFETADLLGDVWDLSRRRPGAAHEWVEALLRKFEVTKRLYTAYDASMRPASGDCWQPYNYALFAAILLDAYRADQDVRYLNGSLKLLDLVDALSRAGVSAATASLAAAAAAAEAELVAALLVRHGISA
jgi:hypothetical protein